MEKFNIEEYPCFVKRDVLRKEIETLGINVNSVYDMFISEVQTYKHGKYCFAWRITGAHNLIGENIKDLTIKQREDLVMQAGMENAFIYEAFVIPISIFDKVPYIGFPANTYFGNSVISRIKLVIGELKREAEQYINNFLSYNEYNFLLRIYTEQTDHFIHEINFQYQFEQSLQSQLASFIQGTGKGGYYRDYIDNKISKIISDNSDNIIGNFKLTSYTRNENRDAIVEGKIRYCYETNYTVKLI